MVLPNKERSLIHLTTQATKIVKTTVRQMTLSNYVIFLQNNSNISPTTLKARIITAKNFLEYSDVDIIPRKFKLKVKIPKVIRKSKEALSKDDVSAILNACSDIRLKTYVMLLAATGFRAVEALSIRIKDRSLFGSTI